MGIERGPERKRPADSGPIGVVSFPEVLAENPYQRLLYEALAPHGYAIRDGGVFKVGWLLGARRSVRVLHFHWPQDHYRHPPRPKGPVSWIKTALFAVRLATARVLGYRIVWTVHEVFPLKTASRRLDRVGGRLLALFSNVLIANDADTAAEAHRELGPAAADVAVVPHSSYVGAYPEGRTRSEVRAELDIPADAFVFLLFGHVSDYKKVDWFVDAFRRARLDNAVLVVAGLVMDEPSGARIAAAAAEDTRVRALLEFIPDDRVSELYAAADAAIAPRQDGGTSGALMLGQSMGVAGIVAAVGNYEEITGGDAAAWLFTPYDQESVTATLAEAASSRQLAQAKGEAGRRLVEPFSWDAMARRTAELLDASLHRTHSPAPSVSAPEHM
jgi:beta-1,4-mannosyltransferase